MLRSSGAFQSQSTGMSKLCKSTTKYLSACLTEDSKPGTILGTRHLSVLPASVRKRNRSQPVHCRLSPHKIYCLIVSLDFLGLKVCLVELIVSLGRWWVSEWGWELYRDQTRSVSVQMSIKSADVTGLDSVHSGLLIHALHLYTYAILHAKVHRLHTWTNHLPKSPPVHSFFPPKREREKENARNENTNPVFITVFNMSGVSNY